MKNPFLILALGFGAGFYFKKMQDAQGVTSSASTAAAAPAVSTPSADLPQILATYTGDTVTDANGGLWVKASNDQLFSQEELAQAN